MKTLDASAEEEWLVEILEGEAGFDQEDELAVFFAAKSEMPEQLKALSWLRTQIKSNDPALGAGSEWREERLSWLRQQVLARLSEATDQGG